MSEGKLKNCHVEEKRSFDVNISAIFFILLFPFTTHAICTPTPDCASIGYTQTSCETKSVKCPFDTSKLFCLPCDTKFQYTCTGDNITGGIGSSCKNKYVSCSCSTSEYTFSNGECKCNDFTPTNCTIGAIYYPNGKCSNEYISCQNPVGVVVKDNELITLVSPPRMLWSPDAVNISGLPDITDHDVAMADYSGFDNTLAIVAHYGASSNTSNNAGVYCYNYAPDGFESSKNKWYLPALGEVWHYLYPNIGTIKSTWSKMGTSFTNHFVVSSTEASTQEAWNVGVHQGSRGWYYKHYGTDYSITCFFSIK